MKNRSMKSEIKKLMSYFYSVSKEVSHNFIPGQIWKLSICPEWLEEKEVRTITKIRHCSEIMEDAKILLPETWMFYSTGSVVMSCMISLGIDQDGIGVVIPKQKMTYFVEKILDWDESSIKEDVDITNLLSVSIIKQIGCDEFINTGYNVLSFEVI